MKELNVNELESIRTIVTNDGVSMYRLADVNKFLGSHRAKVEAQGAVVTDGGCYIPLDAVEHFVKKSRKANAQQVLKLLSEAHEITKKAVAPTPQPQKRTLVDPNKVCINPTQSQATTAVARKDDCEQKIDDAWKSVMKACNDAKALAEACYKRGMEYKKMYQDEVNKGKVITIEDRKKIFNGTNVMTFLAEKYGEQLETMLWREHRRTATPDARGLYTPTAIGELIGVSAHEVNVFLLEVGLQTKNPEKGDNQPKYKVDEMLGKDYAVSEYYEEDNGRKYFQLRWTMKGLHLILGEMYTLKHFAKI